MAAEDLGPAVFDGAHGVALFGQKRVLLPVDLTVGAEDVRDFQARPLLSRWGGSRLVLLHRPLPEELALLRPD
jgi:hypothetical protein